MHSAPTAFEPMLPAQAAAFAGHYLAYLRERDGVPDMAAQRFDLRERFFAEVDADPNRWEGAAPVDQATFDRNHGRNRPEADLDEVTLWALATAKTNRAERYGVDFSLAHNDGAASADAGSDPFAYIQIEECYHTRILRDALATLGVAMQVDDPGLPARVMVRAMVLLPDTYADVAVLCGEIFGVAVFSLLLEKARELFADQPRALARIESLFAQILVDEVGHVHFVRSKLSARQLAWARRLMPVVANAAMVEMPELRRLFGRATILRRAREADVDRAAAAYPDRLTVPAA